MAVEHFPGWRVWKDLISTLRGSLKGRSLPPALTLWSSDRKSLSCCAKIVFTLALRKWEAWSLLELREG